MPIFTLEEIPEIKGSIRFYYLQKDGKCEFKEFKEQILVDGSYESELNKIYTIMLEVASLKYLPEKWYKLLNPKSKGEAKEYEIKTSNLRVYLFHEEKKGHIIVTGGKKKPKQQKRDIKHFRNLKKEYLQSR